MNKLIILGAGGSGEDIVSIVNAINRNSEETVWEIVGYLDDNPELHGKTKLGIEILGTIASADHYENVYFVSSIANPNNRLIRRKIFDDVKKNTGLKFATLVHPTAVLYDNVSLEEGVVINAYCVLGSNTVIGKNVHLAYSCNVAHESKIGDHCAFGTGVNLSSGVDIGDDSYIGVGVAVSHDVTIDSDTLVSVGSAVVSDLKSSGQNMWIGVPAIPIKEFIENKLRLKKIK